MTLETYYGVLANCCMLPLLACFCVFGCMNCNYNVLFYFISAKFFQATDMIKLNNSLFATLCFFRVIFQFYVVMTLLYLRSGLGPKTWLDYEENDLVWVRKWICSDLIIPGFAATNTAVDLLKSRQKYLLFAGDIHTYSCCMQSRRVVTGRLATLKFHHDDLHLMKWEWAHIHVIWGIYAGCRKTAFLPHHPTHPFPYDVFRAAPRDGCGKGRIRSGRSTLQ